jgi:hypothetical protein
MHQSILLRTSFLPGQSDHCCGHIVKAEIHWLIVAGVQDDHDIPASQLQDLELFELRSKECRLQHFEFAEGPWDELVIDGKDEATMSKRVDSLEFESEVLGGAESERSLGLINFLVKVITR